jgi:hypothetical protein
LIYVKRLSGKGFSKTLAKTSPAPSHILVALGSGQPVDLLARSVALVVPALLALARLRRAPLPLEAIPILLSPLALVTPHSETW